MKHLNHQLILNSSINLTELNQQVNFEHLFNTFPACIFIKDKRGKYLDINSSKLQMLGLSHINDIIGLTNFDLCSNEKEAQAFQRNDSEVILTRSNKNFIEKRTLPDGLVYQAISFKSPVLVYKKIIGILGVSFVLLIENMKPVSLINYKKTIPTLTSRQNDCLYYFVCHGMSIKEISKELNLSPRTVEHHLEEVKLKLNCSKRSDLMKKYYEF